MTTPEPPKHWSTLATAVKSCALSTDRDERGRFLTGNSGGGRRPGSRNKLSETFLDTVAKDFAEHGLEAVERVRKEEPATYLKLIAWLVPRELILQREQAPDIDLAEISYEEAGELIKAERRRQTIRNALREAGR